MFDYDPRLGRVRQLVLANLRDPPSLKDAAEVACLESTYFSRLFRQRVGVTYTEWLRLTRVFQAKAVLRRSDVRIGELARRVGYRDPRGFQKAFRRVEGITPSEFRRRVRLEHRGESSEGDKT